MLQCVQMCRTSIAAAAWKNDVRNIKLKKEKGLIFYDYISAGAA